MDQETFSVEPVSLTNTWTNERSRKNTHLRDANARRIKAQHLHVPKPEEEKTHVRDRNGKQIKTFSLGGVSLLVEHMDEREVWGKHASS